MTGCRHVEFKKTIKWDQFNDGWPNLFIENVKEMAGRDGEAALGSVGGGGRDSSGVSAGGSNGQTPAPLKQSADVSFLV